LHFIGELVNKRLHCAPAKRSTARSLNNASRH